MKKTEKIWHNGKLIPWDDARIHILSHVIHYASAVFEGLRCYKTPSGPQVFRLSEHIARLCRSAKIYRMKTSFGEAELVAGVVETLQANRLDECYIRPVIFRGYGSMGVDPTPCPIETYIAVWPWGAYLGSEALEKGVDVMVSSWNRMAPNTLPALAKASANYMNAQLIKLEAVTHGFAEAIALDVQGYVSEGSGENVFLVMDDTLVTPPLCSSVLPGITRDAVIRLAGDAGIEVQERSIPRESLYVADEVFFTGTAAEITPVRSVDRIQVGNGKRGPVTRKLQQLFFGLLQGEIEDRYGWLTPVASAAAVEAS
ncbi:MAG: branched-chain amino acid transaminase [Acidobacteriota bacterium]